MIVDLARPANRVAATAHRAASSVFLPAAGLIAKAPRDYWYLHRSLDTLPPPEVLFVNSPLRQVAAWRMGPLGFVYGTVLEKA